MEFDTPWSFFALVLQLPRHPSPKINGVVRPSLIYSSTFCETKKTTDYTDFTDRNITVSKIRAIRGLNSGVHNVVTTVDGFVNNSG